MDAFLDTLGDLGMSVVSDIGGLVLLLVAALAVQGFRYMKKHVDWFSTVTEWFGVTVSEENFRKWAYQAAEELYERYLEDLDDSDEDLKLEDYLDKAVRQAVDKYAPKNFEWAGLDEDHVRSIIRKRWRELTEED